MLLMREYLLHSTKMYGQVNDAGALIVCGTATD